MSRPLIVSRTGRVEHAADFPAVAANEDNVTEHGIGIDTGAPSCSHASAYDFDSSLPFLTHADPQKQIAGTPQRLFAETMACHFNDPQALPIVGTNPTMRRTRRTIIPVNRQIRRAGRALSSGASSVIAERWTLLDIHARYMTVWW
jgi:hypothetical protein